MLKVKLKMESVTLSRKEPQNSAAKFKKAIFFNPLFAYDPAKISTRDVARSREGNTIKERLFALGEIFTQGKKELKVQLRGYSIIPDILGDEHNIIINDIDADCGLDQFVESEGYSQVSFSGAWGRIRGCMEIDIINYLFCHAPFPYNRSERADFTKDVYPRTKEHYREMLSESIQCSKFISNQLGGIECKLDIKHVLIQILIIEAFQEMVKQESLTLKSLGTLEQRKEVFLKWKAKFRDLLSSEEKRKIILANYILDSNQVEKAIIDLDDSKIAEIAEEFEKGFKGYRTKLPLSSIPCLRHKLLIAKSGLAEKLELNDAEKIILGGENSLKEYIETLDFTKGLTDLKKFLRENIAKTSLPHGLEREGLLWDGLHSQTIEFDPLGVFKIYLNPRSAEAFIALNHELILQPNIYLGDIYQLFDEKIKAALGLTEYKSEGAHTDEKVYINSNSIYFTRSFVGENLGLEFPLLDCEKQKTVINVKPEPIEESPPQSPIASNEKPYLGDFTSIAINLKDQQVISSPSLEKKSHDMPKGKIIEIIGNLILIALGTAALSAALIKKQELGKALVPLLALSTSLLILGTAGLLYSSLCALLKPDTELAENRIAPVQHLEKLGNELV